MCLLFNPLTVNINLDDANRRGRGGVNLPAQYIYTTVTFAPLQILIRILLHRICE